MLPRWLSDKEFACKRRRFDPWVGKILQKRKWQPTPVFLPEKSHGQRSLKGYIRGVMRVGQNLATEYACIFIYTDLSPFLNVLHQFIIVSVSRNLFNHYPAGEVQIKTSLITKQHFHLVKRLSLLTFYRCLRLYISFEFTVVTFFP